MPLHDIALFLTLSCYWVQTLHNKSGVDSSGLLLELLACSSCTQLFAGPWLQEFTDLRDKINTLKLKFGMIREVIAELDVRIPQTGRNYPIPKISERALARMEREAALAGQVLKDFKGENNRMPNSVTTGVLVY